MRFEALIADLEDDFLGDAEVLVVPAPADEGEADRGVFPRVDGRHLTHNRGPQGQSACTRQELPSIAMKGYVFHCRNLSKVHTLVNGVLNRLRPVGPHDNASKSTNTHY